VTATPHKLGAGSQAGLYYTNDSAREARPDRRDEYYTRDGGGVWWSSGESVVRHGAAIDGASFRDLCAGINPGTGKALVRGAGEGHWAGLDVCMTPGKSVSVLWMAGTPEQRDAIEGAHQLAVDRALRFIVDEGLVVVRQGAGGKERSRPTDLIVAEFRHFTTREGDPNIHSHCVIMNAAGAPKNRSSQRYATALLTIDPEKLYSWQLVVGAAYRSAIAEQLGAAGLTPRPAGRGQWELEGLPQDFLEIFSKRSHQIEALVGRNATAAQKQIAALQTRRAKEDVPTGVELEQRWQEELAQTGVDPWDSALRPKPDQTVSLDQSEERLRDLAFDPPEIVGSEPVAVAASELFRHDSVIDRQRLLEGALIQAALKKLGPDEVYLELARLEASGGLLRLSADCWTTPAIAACEAAMLRAADRPQEREWFSADAVASALGNATYLTAEQNETVRQAARSDGVSIVEAGAGTGKTTLARVLVDAARQSGLRVIGLAPSWVAADELSASTGVKAIAIARWRHDHAQGRGVDFDASTIIIVDEAGMTGTRDMAAILAAARENRAKVVLIGDRRQLASVSGASALKAVSEVVRRGAVLDGVRRQTVEWQRAASVVMARGDAEAGMRAYAAQDRMEFVSGEATAQDRVISIWKDQRAQYGEDVLIVTRRNSDGVALNKAAREVLRSEGLIKGEELEMPAIDREDKHAMLALSRGDRVRFSENLSHLAIRNGNRGVVERLHRDEQGDVQIAFSLEDGRLVDGPWQAFVRKRLGKKILPPRIAHAYAGTVYSVQGRTAAASVLYIARSTDAREVYVGLTRHTGDAHIVVECDRLDALCRQRQADHRMKPTLTAIRERLFGEARQYREKANVVDHCADRSVFTRTGQVELPSPEASKWTVERALLGARGLREALGWLDPSRLFVPIWRLIERGKGLTPELPPKLSAIINRARERGIRAKDISRFHGHDR
jgi:conjugative relaxase-like TrwC/TraI family protein